MFSSRLPPRLAPNAVTRAVASARAAGTRLLDLTETNPTRAGIPYPQSLADVFVDLANLSYSPEPLGLPAARSRIASEIRPGVESGQIVLTASTSEAYAFLFKLLCDPGDEVLVPRPSYPLFDLLTNLEAVRPVAYRLDRHSGWSLDRDSLVRAHSPRTRAILVVSPNNPTGSRLRSDDRDWLVDFAATRGVALIADEVFEPYPLTDRSDAVSLCGEAGALVFTLGGLSKSAGLPQMKLAWIVASGPAPVLSEALARLEVIADTYLSVATPVQVAADRLIDAGQAVRTAIAERLAVNLHALRGVIGGDSALTLLEPDGGWSAVIRVPALQSEETLVLRLIEEAGVLVHPGFFFDFEDEAYLVVSLLTDPAVFRDGLHRLAALCDPGAGPEPGRGSLP